MDVLDTALSGVKIVSPKRFGDARGYFSECWNKARMDAADLHYDFVQDNHSFSSAVGTLRGLHMQTPPHAQAKLVRCGRGKLFDVAVDIRVGSPTFGKWIGEELSADNGKQLLIPIGFLHGFITLEPNTEILYKCTGYYAPDCDRSVRFDDPALAIDWPISRAPILSDKDADAPLLSEIDNPFTFAEHG